MENSSAGGFATRISVSIGLLVLIGLLGALLVYKSSSSLRTIEGVRAAHAWTRSADPITTGGALRATGAYFDRIWPALLFGLLIGAAVRALVSPKWFAELLAARRPIPRQIAAGLAGAPMMLCSCCVTPVFTSVYEAGLHLAPALGMMLGSPGLNPAALVLTVMLFPTGVAAARIGAAAIAVFVLPLVLERIFGDSARVAAPVADVTPAPQGPRTAGDFARGFARSFLRLSVTTVPLIVGGVLLSSLILPTLGGEPRSAWVAVPLVSAVAVVVALPTFFEIPLALVLMQLAGPAAAAPMLFAGPIVNLPSLFILARQSRAPIAIALAAGIWLLALAAAWAAHLLT